MAGALSSRIREDPEPEGRGPPASSRERPSGSRPGAGARPD